MEVSIPGMTVFCRLTHISCLTAMSTTMTTMDLVHRAHFAISHLNAVCLRFCAVIVLDLKILIDSLIDDGRRARS